jgi:hypothetical protein
MTRAGLGLGFRMSSFSDREQGFEGKFAHDQEREFRAAARRNRMLGEWAARRMGLENVDDYARAVVKSDIDQPGDDDVLRKVSQDLAGSGLSVPLSEIRAKMDEFLAIARGQIEAGN